MPLKMDMLAARDVRPPIPRKTQQQLENMVNRVRSAAHASALNQLPETA